MVKCPACGEPIDYCLGHGAIGDPVGRAILDAHDEGRHDLCDPLACDGVEIRKRINAWAEAEGVTVVLLDPADVFDPAIVGIARRFTDYFALYDESVILERLAEDFADAARETEEDPWAIAREHYEVNVIGGWVGEATPAFLIRSVEGEG